MLVGNLLLWSRRLHYCSIKSLLVRRSFTVVSSVEPACEGRSSSNGARTASNYYERPGTVLYVESPYYARTGNSWKGYFQQEFPYRGIHYVNVTIWDGIHRKSSINPYLYLKQAEEQLASDVSMFPAPTLITRGGLLSIVAQFYLESYALSGLVMIDPYISPEVALSSSSEPHSSMSTSCSMLLQSMEVEESKSLHQQQQQQHVVNKEEDIELHLLKLLSYPNISRKDIRLLKLEPSSVPILLMYPSTSTAIPLTGYQEWTTTSVQKIVDYHGNTEEGTVDVHYLQQQQQQKAVETINTVMSWLDEKVG